MTPHMLSSCPILENRTTVCTRWGTVHRFFLVTVRLCNVCICLTGPKYRRSTLHSLCSKTSEQPEDARFDKYGHPWIYPLDGAR
ncbi:MAG TPA: hypothetical protein DDY83_02520 [Bifidobacterium dentium]|nr:hypothetical protein [Bifidobacterium dentium]